MTLLLNLIRVDIFDPKILRTIRHSVTSVKGSVRPSPSWRPGSGCRYASPTSGEEKR